MSARKLLLAKALLGHAEYVLRAPGPFDHGIALACLQDAIEVAIYAVAAHVGAKATPNTQFQQYWQLIRERAAGDPARELPMEMELAQLNRARNNFKHHTINPTREDVETYFVNGRAFLGKVSNQFFAIDFDSLSEVELVPQQEVHEHLSEAQKEVRLGDNREALIRCANAWAEMRKEQQQMFMQPVLVTYSNLQPELEKRLRSEVSHLRSQIDDLSGFVFAGALGLNLMDYRLLRRCLPTIRGTEITFKFDPQSFDPKQVEHCIALLARYAVRLQRELDAMAHPGWSAAETGAEG
jgi:hypothetical protein